MSERAAEPLEHRVRDAERTPWLGLILAYLAMLPPVAAAAIAWSGVEDLAGPVIDVTVVWVGALLAFFAGVQRGLSFRTEGGPTRRQVASMLVLFGLAVAVLGSPGSTGALLLAAAGFVVLVIVDRTLAKTGDVPAFMARLRPIQMIFPVAACLLLALRAHQLR